MKQSYRHLLCFPIRFLLVCSTVELKEPALVHFGKNALAGKKRDSICNLACSNCFAYLLKREWFCYDNSVPNEETSKLVFVFPETSKYLMAKSKTGFI